LATSKGSMVFDFYNKDEFFKMFNGKNPTKIPRYIKILDNLDNKMRADKKCRKVLFGTGIE
jgi:hypothetical protein